MFDNIQQAIKYIYDNSSEENRFNSKIFLSLLNDLVPSLVNERRVFQRVINDDVLRRYIVVVTSSKSVEVDLLREKKRIEDEFGLSDSWSSLITESFAEAFGHRVTLTKNHSGEIESSTEKKTNDRIVVDAKPQSRQAQLLEQKNLLLKEKSTLGLFSVKRKAEIEKQITDIDYELSIKRADETISAVVRKESPRTNDSGLQITSISVFSSDGTVTGRRLYNNVFFNREIKYVGIELSFKTGQTIPVANIKWRICKENGSPFSNEIIANVNVTPSMGCVFHQWGWQEIGHWPIGKYIVYASINGGETVKTSFEITNGSYNVFPSKLKNLRMFNGGSTPPPVENREYMASFHKVIAKKIYFQVEFSMPGVNLLTTIDYVIKKSNTQQIITNRSTPISIQHNYAACWVGYGWDDPGHWETGWYEVSISVGKSDAITGYFEITD